MIIFEGNEKIVELLINATAYVNFRANDLATSLHRAVKQGMNIFVAKSTMNHHNSSNFSSNN